MMIDSNKVRIAGKLQNGLHFSHETAGNKIYTGTIASERLSGTVDLLQVMIPHRLYEQAQAVGGRRVMWAGQCRHCVRIIDGEKRHVLVLFVLEIDESDDDNLNAVEIHGTILNQLKFRETPFGRRCCDLMLEVTRAYGKTDRIPCIVWGFDAKWASEHYRAGDKVCVKGRLQSREYQKLLPDGGCAVKTTYEVSAQDVYEEFGMEA